MEELVEYIERTPKARHAHRWKHYLRALPPPLCDARTPKTWQPAYTMKAINAALSHVQIVAYNENIVRFCVCVCVGGRVGNCCISVCVFVYWYWGDGG